MSTSPRLDGRVLTRPSAAANITFTCNDLLYSVNKPDAFILSTIEFTEGDAHRLRFARRPFQREPDFGVTGVNYSFTELLARAEKPSRTGPGAMRLENR